MFRALFGTAEGESGSLQATRAGSTSAMAEPVGVSIGPGDGEGDDADEGEGADMESEEEGEDSEIAASVSASASRRHVAAVPAPPAGRLALPAPSPLPTAERPPTAATPSSSGAPCGQALVGDESGLSMKRNSNALRRRSLPTSAGASSGGAMGAVDLGEHSDWTSIKMHGMSLNEPFPEGQLLKALQRALNTMHKHILELSKCEWFPKQKPTSLKAMAGRWSDHEPKMQQEANLDVQVAYKQLVARASALYKLHCALRRWLGNRDTSIVSDIVAPLEVLEPVVHWKKAELAPDMQILRFYGQFHRAFGMHRFPSAAMSTLHRPTLEAQVQTWKDDEADPCREPDPKAHLIVKEEPGVFKGNAVMEGEKADEKKTAKQYVAPPMELRIKFGSSARAHAATLVAEVMKLFYRALPDNLTSEIDAVTNAVAEIERTYNEWLRVWAELVHGDTDDGASEFGEVSCSRSSWSWSAGSTRSAAHKHRKCGRPGSSSSRR